MNPFEEVRYLRLNRSSTGSSISYDLCRHMPIVEAEKQVQILMPEWTILVASFHELPE